MTRTVVTRTIAAPVERVFRTVSDVREFSKAVPTVVDVEFLSESRTGTGTRFRETRTFGKREASTELEVVDHVENRRVRLVSEAGGTVWDSVFSVRPEGDVTVLELVMEAAPRTLLARITTPLMKPVVRRALEKDMDAIKSFCEAAPEPEDRPGSPGGDRNA